MEVAEEVVVVEKDVEVANNDGRWGSMRNGSCEGGVGRLSLVASGCGGLEVVEEVVVGDEEFEVVDGGYLGGGGGPTRLL